MSTVTSRKSTGNPPRVAVTAALVVLTVCAYGRTLGNDFIVGYDDSSYILSNPGVLGGLSMGGLSYALTGLCGANWHPLTVLSHQLDVTFFGINPVGHHAVNIAFHAANVALLFHVLMRATGNRGASLCVAMLFAVHPIHVQNVAAVFQRKDLLSTFFLLVALREYVKPTRSMVKVTLWCGLGLLAKPMLVTAPALFLLFDVWPLNRLELSPIGMRRDLAARVREKLPIIALSVVFCLTTLWAQSESGAVAGSDLMPIHLRFLNALLSYAAYLRLLVWPAGLSIFYPYPTEFAITLVALAAVLLGILTIAVFMTARRHPYALVGWLWFLGAMVPVIGLVQVGSQAMADRYGYVPFWGLYIVIAWGAKAVLARLNVSPRASAVVLGLVVAGLLVRTWIETGYWRDNVTLWERAAAVTRSNETVHVQLTLIRAERNELDAALIHAEEAVRLSPTVIPMSQLAKVYYLLDRIPEAEAKFKAVLAIDPNYSESVLSYGRLLLEFKRYDEAKQVFAVTNDNAVASMDVARVCMELGAFDLAENYLNRAIELDPQQPTAYLFLGMAQEKQNKAADAIRAYEKALTLDATLSPAQAGLIRLSARR